MSRVRLTSANSAPWAGGAQQNKPTLTLRTVGQSLRQDTPYYHPASRMFQSAGNNHSLKPQIRTPKALIKDAISTNPPSSCRGEIFLNPASRAKTVTLTSRHEL